MTSLDALQEPSFSVAPFASHAPTSTTPIVTCAATSSKFVLLGLSDGSVSLYDVFGNRLDHHQSLHATSVAAVALGGGPAADKVVASASADGKIRAARLYAGNTTAQKSHSILLSAATVAFTKQWEASVSAIVVDPSFGKPRFGDRVAFADVTGRVVIHTYGWFGGVDVVIAQPSNTLVPTIFWVHNLLSFPAPDGVHVYDTRINRLVCLVAPPGSSTPTSPIARKSPLKSLENSLPYSSDSVVNVVTSEKQPNQSTETELLSVKEEQSESNLDASQTSEPPQSSASHPTQPVPAAAVANTTTTGWALHTSVFMEEDVEGEVSPHGEPTVRIYVTWPAGARIVRVGPHGEHIPTPEKPTRNITVVFKVEREAIFPSPVPEIPPRPPPVYEAPLLAMVPFGENESIALVGTQFKSLALHLISSEGQSVKDMVMPQRALRHAHLLTIPGGDPLVLIIAHPDTSTPDTSTPDNTGNVAANVADVICVRSLTTAERVKWLLGKGRFHDALNVAQSAPGGSLRRAEVSIEDVGEQFLDSLMETGDFEHLANVLQETIATTTPYAGFRARERAMHKRKRRWERWIGSFRDSNHLELIAPVIPTFDPVLHKNTYDQILVDLAASNPPVMLTVLKTWPSDLYNVSTITKAIEKQLGLSAKDSSQASNDREPLREGLLMMYGLSGRHDETLNLLLREKSPKVYEYIRSHHLYEAVRSQDTIAGLYSIDPAAATETLAKAPETVLPPEAVVPILTKINNTEWMFMYLHAVFRADPDHAPKYHNLMLSLYVKHGPPGTLFNFLKTSSHYSLDRALQEMGGPKGKAIGQFAKERVYILSAMGDLNSAMNILLDELGDTFAAIEFASDHGDTVLWERLIEHARTHADTLAALLDSPAGGKVDPVRLIPLLNSEMKIPHLRDRLHRVLVDAALERALREDAAAALHHDASLLLERLDECVTTLPP